MVKIKFGTASTDEEIVLIIITEMLMALLIIITFKHSAFISSVLYNEM